MLLGHPFHQPTWPKLKSYRFMEKALTPPARIRDVNMKTQAAVGPLSRGPLLMLVSLFSLLVSVPQFPLGEPSPLMPVEPPGRCPVLLLPRCLHMIHWPYRHSLLSLWDSSKWIQGWKTPGADSFWQRHPKSLNTTSCEKSPGVALLLMLFHGSPAFWNLWAT